jgi:hypothetical protein
MRKDYGEPSRLWSAIWTGDRRLALGCRSHPGLGSIHFRRLALRYERRANVHEAFLTLGCALIT